MYSCHYELPILISIVHRMILVFQRLFFFSRILAICSFLNSLSFDFIDTSLSYTKWTPLSFRIMVRGRGCWQPFKTYLLCASICKFIMNIFFQRLRDDRSGILTIPDYQSIMLPLGGSWKNVPLSYGIRISIYSSFLSALQRSAIIYIWQYNWCFVGRVNCSQVLSWDKVYIGDK